MSTTDYLMYLSLGFCVSAMSFLVLFLVALQFNPRNKYRDDRPLPEKSKDRSSMFYKEEA